MKEEDIEKGIETLDKVLPESQSQQDRENLANTREMSLVTFINSQIERANNKNALKDSVISKLKIKADEDEMTIPEFIKLLEIIDKGDNDLILGLFNTMKDVGANQTKDKENESFNFSAEEVDTVKKLLKLMKFSDIITTTEGE